MKSLPKTLDDTYARILQNIDQEHNQDAFQILQWLVFSARPLRLKEVCEVIALDPDNNFQFNESRRLVDPFDIQIICSSLIIMSVEEFYEESDEESDEEPDEEFSKLYPRKSTKARDGNVTYIRLAHFSVKEYLVSTRIEHGLAKNYSIQEIKANTDILRTCIGYLSTFDKPDSLTPRNLKRFPLA